jgi:DNA-binding NarL/FixJ family response regulator
MTIRVLVADDQPVVRAGFQTILQSQPDITVVGEAGNGREAVEQARRLRPDVVLMDIRMPEMDGLQATRLLAGPDVPDPVRVLVLTTFDLDDYIYEALRAGASGFLLKDARRDDLVTAVRVVAAGDALLAPSVTRRLIQEFARRPPASADELVQALTPRERDVFELVARGLANAEIADRLHLGEATVKSHVTHMLLKLGLRDRIQVVIHAYETGLIRPGETSS